MARDKTDETPAATLATTATRAGPSEKVQPFPRDPLEVFEAVEGQPESLVALLRSGEPLCPDTREALALWLEGNLPPKRGRGRPKKMRARGEWPAAKEAELAAAAERYRWLQKGLAKRGIRAFSAERLKEKVANHPKQGCSLEQLELALRGDYTFSTVAETIPERFLLWRQRFRKK